jgi:predicted ATP-grasp superfamily ATP-dependent carboligase
MKKSISLKGVVVIEGHVQGLANTRALGKEGIPVIVISEFNCLARYSKYCRKFFRCPGYLSPEFITFLVKLAVEENLQDWMLLPSNDHAVYTISEHSEELKKYYKIISPEKPVFESIYNKELLIRRCMSEEIPVPVSWFPKTPDELENISFKGPVLVKGKNGLSFYKQSGKKAFLVKDKDDLIAILNKLTQKTAIENVYLQELIPAGRSKPVSFTAFSINGEIKSFWMGCKIREHPIEFGTATYSRSVNIPGLFPPAQKIIKSLGFTGVCEIEFLIDPRDNEYKLIEINARTWLWVGLAIKDGINFPLMIYRFLHSEEFQYPQDFNTGSEWMHYMTDIPYSLKGLVTGQYSFRNLAESYLKFPLPAVFNPGDILPSFAEVLLLPFLIMKR